MGGSVRVKKGNAVTLQSIRDAIGSGWLVILPLFFAATAFWAWRARGKAKRDNSSRPPDHFDE